MQWLAVPLHQSNFLCLDSPFPPDDAVRTHFVFKPLGAGTTAEDIERVYLRFLASLFSKIKLKLGAEPQKGTKPLYWWRDYWGNLVFVHSSIRWRSRTFHRWNGQSDEPHHIYIYLWIIVSHRSKSLKKRPRMRSKNSPRSLAKVPLRLSKSSLTYTLTRLTLWWCQPAVVPSLNRLVCVPASVISKLQ